LAVAVTVGAKVESVRLFLPIVASRGARALGAKVESDSALRPMVAFWF